MSLERSVTPRTPLVSSAVVVEGAAARSPTIAKSANENNERSEGNDEGTSGPSNSSLSRRRNPNLRLELPVDAPVVTSEEKTDILLSPKKTSRRAVFVDWARSIAVYVVVCVHIMVSVQRVTTPPPVMKQKIDGSFRVVLQYGLPMFFYFSGRSAAFANVSFLAFLKGKILRLVLPLVIGLCVVVVPTNYIGREYRGCSPPGVNNFFEYYAAYFKNFGCNGFDWYWFLPVLFVLSVVNQYFLFWVKSREQAISEAGDWPSGPRTWRSRIVWNWRRDAGPAVFLVVLLSILAVVCHFIGCPYYLLVLTFSPHICMYAMVIFKSFIKRFSLIYALYVPCPLFSLVLAMVVHDHYDDALPFSSFSGVLIMCLFYNFYYVQGYFDTVFDEEWHQWRDTASLHAGLKPIALLVLIVSLAICAPTTSDFAGYLYEYPMYKADGYLCFFYVAGGWLWLMLWIRYAQTFYNEVLNEFEYTHITTSSMLVYLVHWFFIDCISVLIIRPANMGIVGGIAVLVPGVALCCGLLYLAVCLLERCVKRRLAARRKRRQEAADVAEADDGDRGARGRSRRDEPEPVKVD